MKNFEGKKDLVSSFNETMYLSSEFRSMCANGMVRARCRLNK